MSTYLRLLGSMSLADKNAVQSALQNWSSTCEHGRRVVPNIERDRFLPDMAMLELLNTIKTKSTISTASLLDEYSRACWRYSLQGGDVVFASLPVLLGRAVDQEVFIDHLWQHFSKIFLFRGAVERFVDRIVVATTRITPREAAAYMTLHAAWVTWNQRDRLADPFEFASNHRGDEVRANLGLKSKRKGRSADLLLLCYKFDGTCKLYRPTIADAALYPFFQPPGDGEDRHGWTVPWPREEISHLPSTVELSPRPEGLHERQSVGILEIPVRSWK
jgi:hypothetical protein